MMKRFTVRFLALLLAGALLSAASARSITMAMGAQPETLDPQVTSATSSFQVARSIYDTLAQVDRDGELVPGLAESWEVSEDGLAWTFHLRDGVTFHDGSPFDSADVKATLERIVSAETASPKASEFATITDVATPDDLTVVLELSAPTPALLASLASGWGAILPAEKVAEGHDFGNAPVGTGAFKLERWVRDSHIELSRNDAYFAGAPQVEGVTIRFVADSAVQLQGLLAGEFDIIDTPTSPDFDLIEANPSLTLVRAPSGLVNVATLNTRREVLSDPRVRQALNYAVDKETILEVAYGGGVLVGTFMEAGSPWLPEDVQPYPYDPERARALLQEAGVPSGWRVDLVLPQAYDEHITAGQMLQGMLGEVGVNAEIRLIEWGVWLAEVYAGAHDFDITVIGHTGKLDPTGRLASYDSADRNYPGFGDPEVTTALHQAAVTPDQDERRELYAQVLRALHDEAPFIYLGTPYTIYAHRSNVDGFWITPLLDSFNFSEVSLR